MSADKLDEAIDRAIARITSGLAPMRIPADPDSDPDLVLSRCKIARQEDRAEIERLRGQVEKLDGENDRWADAYVLMKERAEAAEAKIERLDKIRRGLHETIVDQRCLISEANNHLTAERAKSSGWLEQCKNERLALEAERAKNAKLVEALEGAEALIQSCEGALVVAAMHGVSGTPELRATNQHRRDQMRAALADAKASEDPETSYRAESAKALAEFDRLHREEMARRDHQLAMEAKGYRYNWATDEYDPPETEEKP